MPIGRPPFEKPTGTEIAGQPISDQIAVIEIQSRYVRQLAPVQFGQVQSLDRKRHSLGRRTNQEAVRIEKGDGTAEQLAAITFRSGKRGAGLMPAALDILHHRLGKLAAVFRHKRIPCGEEARPAQRQKGVHRARDVG